MMGDRRSFLRFVAGIGLGAVAVETYERLYNIPSLERRLRSEVNHWINEYNSAKDVVEKLSQQLNVSKDEASRLSAEVNNWKNQYNAARDEVNRLGSTINTLDELEKESAAAISVYKERMEEAMRRLKNTIEKYRAILGDERVSFESSSLKVLEDLKITQEKLLKLLPYFPLIKSLNYNPSKVVNDKIYDLSVSLEVISPLNTFEEVEVMLIPVEYRYFITSYGMREEDYHKVFPKEEIRSVKVEPKKREEEMFSVDFKDLKGGRGYIVKASVKDFAGNEKIVEVKTPYIRQFENIANTDDVIVIADYYTWYKPNWGKHTFMPILGEYDSGDPIVIAKHIDWATGYGIDAFAISWWGNDLENPNRQVTGGHPYDLMNFENTFLTHPMIDQIKFCVLYENTGRLKIQNPNDTSEQWIQDLDDSFNRKRLLSDFIYFEKYFSHPQYLKIDGKPVVVFDYTLPFRGNIAGVFTELRNEIREKGWELYLVNDLAGRSFYPSDLLSGDVAYPPGLPVSPEHVLQIIENTDAFSGSGPPQYYEMDIEKTYGLWSQFAQSYKKDFIPVAWPGFGNVIPRSSEHFLSLLERCRKYNTRKIIRIPSFNEWYYAHQIEPAHDYSFQYLEILKSFIEKYYKQ